MRLGVVSDFATTFGRDLIAQWFQALARQE
jgi:hypothetical protein